MNNEGILKTISEMQDLLQDIWDLTLNLTQEQENTWIDTDNQIRKLKSVFDRK